ncbi:MAG: YjjG family noncanonical pyrimidine nucleotidase [Bacteroidota bacterium]
MSKSKKYEWLLFDADNTLFDFDGSAELAFWATLEEMGMQRQADYFQTYLKINKKVWKELEEQKITQDELRSKRFDLFLQATNHRGDPIHMNHKYLMNLVDHTKMLPGAVDLLKNLESKFKLAIITNGLKEVQRPRINRADIGNFFHTIVVSDEIGYSKPHKGFFDYTFNQIGHPAKDQVLVIGDSLSSDITGGNNYGVDTCWYNPTHKASPPESKPTFEVSGFLELETLVTNPPGR